MTTYKKPALNDRALAVLAYVEANPGREVASVAAALGLETKQAINCLNSLYTRHFVDRQKHANAFSYFATREQGS